MKLPYMPMWWGDYDADTMDLSLEEHGAYLLLIKAYWVRQGPLPKDEESIIRLLRLVTSEVTVVMRLLQRFFERGHDDRWYHPRIDAELEKAKKGVAQRSEAGKKSAEARWGNERYNDRVNETDNEGNANQSHSQNQSHKSNTESKSTPYGAKPSVSTPSKRGTRIPKDWQLSEELFDWAIQEKGLYGEGKDRTAIEKMAEHFYDYWSSKAGADAVKLDWDKTWKNWVRRDRTLKPSFQTSVPVNEGPDADRERKRAQESAERRRERLELVDTVKNMDKRDQLAFYSALNDGQKLAARNVLHEDVWKQIAANNKAALRNGTEALTGAG